MVRAAEIMVDGDDSAISCVLVDISETGARLRLPPGVEAPDRFRLCVVSMSIDVICEVRWRRESDMGVAFKS